ncbi:hypothetical protein [Parasitella parasitica]|uniref:F-box domain-containing protein n=1 Tax=Parasitella parasitica TaxID=35722 RepID=A0A0B7NHF3_9FUNG|nr:hypothetical protein [Parasitella parasitica]
MDRLPLEIFNEVTSYLTCREKQKLLLVCQYWHEVIKSGNLFNNFSTKGHLKFKAGALFFEQNETHRKQVRSLRLTKPEASLDYILAIPERFPWLLDFVWANYGLVDYKDGVKIDNEKVKNWKNITQFGEFNRYPLSIDILKFGGFCNLTQLMINFHFSDTDCRPLVEQLAHAPKLKLLDLASAKMTLVDLELLHFNTPQLETLYLSQIMQEEDDIFEAQLEERRAAGAGAGAGAVSIAHILADVRMLNMRIPTGGFGLLAPWMTYVAAKYHYIKHLTIGGVGMTRGRHDYYETELTDIVSGCPHITSYRVNIFPITPMILAAMDKNGIQLNRIDLVDDPTVEQIDHLLDSSQSNSLVTIIMDDTHLDSTQLVNALESFSNLKHLEVGNKFRKPIFLDTLLCRLKCLETLKLSTWDICLESLIADNVQTKLRSLILEKVVINNVNTDVMSFISSACPDLSKLSIQGQIEGPGRIFRVEFPHHYFTLIKLDILSNEYYKVNNRRQITWYRFKGRYLQESLRDDNTVLNNRPHVSIVYQGTTSLNVGGTDIPNW